MNSTLRCIAQSLRRRRGTGRRKLARLVQADLKAPPPKPGTPFAGEMLIRQLCAAPQSSKPYYMAQTVTAALLTPVFGWAGYTAATDPDPAMWSGPLACVLFALCGLCVYFVIGKSYGPAVIDKKRFEVARERLDGSGDRDSPPMSLALTLAVALVLTVDGALSGFTLTSNAFASTFTPTIALWASCAWSMGTAWLIWELVANASREAVIGQRRATIRNLLFSRDPDAVKRAQAMQHRLVHVLGHDYAASSRWRARLLLSSVVLVLAASTFVMRVISEHDVNEAEIAPEKEAASAEATDPPGVEGKDWIRAPKLQPMVRLGQ